MQITNSPVGNHLSCLLFKLVGELELVSVTGS